MAESIVSDVVGRLLGYLGKSAAGKIAFYFGGIDKLNDLQQTMMMIQARLLDAERLREGEDGALVKLWLKRLKDVLYRLEDLFEEVSMADKQREQMTADKRVCFSVSNVCLPRMNRSVAHDVQAIMRELEGVTSDMHKLHLRVHSVEEQHSLTLISGRQTHSFILEEEVFGRDENKDEIVQMLLSSVNGGDDLSVIPIVGIGGLGKTTLAQLVYNDSNVQQHFELRCWVCIAEVCNFEELAGKILRSVTGHDCSQLSIEQIQTRLRDSFKDKKYLLVLDDVWDEDRERWLCLRRLLYGGKRASIIIVTSRSKVVGLNMGTVEPYELKGLPEDKSWMLFKSLAFKEGQEGRLPNLTAIGRKIVKKCANVPLAIRTIAGLLYSKDTEEEWLRFEESEIRMIEQNENTLIPTLKLSYDHLPPQLKQCFAYCSLFPKDYEFDKQQLCWLWMAQGFVQPLGRNESTDDLSHAYFMELLRRCFFQDVASDFYGRTHYKMHDLMHDLALAVGDECLSVQGAVEHINDNARHVNFTNVQGSSWKTPSWLLDAPQMRSLLLGGHFQKFSAPHMCEIFSSLRRLRTLDLGKGYYKSLPNSIGELKHLRYLRVRVSSFYLPTGITRLQNLRTLDLRDSDNLRELPKGFNKLIRLEHLQIRCSLRDMNGGVLVDGGSLVDMPCKFGLLTSLHTLDKFIVGKNNGLDMLASMNLAGGFQIFYKKHRLNAASEAMMANLKNKKLTNLLLNWSFMSDEVPASQAEELLECLQPPSTLKALKVQEWPGVRFPSWGMDVFPCLLPNLISIRIEGCLKCQHLPSLGRLPHLKTLEFRSLHALEYIETGCSSNSVASSSSSTAYFPALEYLSLKNLPKLKGWWSLQYTDIDQHILNNQSFAGLRTLIISNCPNLISLPLLPKLGSLVGEPIHRTLERLSLLENLDISTSEELDLLDVGNGDGVSTSVTSAAWRGMKNLHFLRLGYISKLKSLPIGLGYVTSLQELWIWNLCNLEVLPETIGNLTRLRVLLIEDCPALTALPESIQNLTALQDLRIIGCPELKRRYQRPDGRDWPLIQHIPLVAFPT